MGSGLSLLTPEQLQNLKDTTHLEEKEIASILKRYSAYDSSEKGTDGIAYETLIMFPEFSTSPFIPRIAELYIEQPSQRIFPENFIYFVTVLRSQTAANVKQDLAFRCFDLYGKGVLKYEELFRMYKMLFKNALTDDQIVDMVFRALEHPLLTEPGQVTQEDFNRFIPENEIVERFTVDLQLY